MTMPTNLPPKKPAAAAALSPSSVGIALNWMALVVAIGLGLWVVYGVNLKSYFSSPERPAISLSNGES
jgi:uncharacterized protein HemX